MFRNYFKTAWRNLVRNKSFALTNLVSLTIGITATLLILLWVQSELSWNKHYKNYSSTYQLYANRNFNGNIYTDNSIILPLADALEQELPQVKYATFTSYSEDRILANGDKKLKKSGYRVSKHYFKVFPQKVLKGDPETALAIPDGLVVTRSTALALFNSEDVINKIVRIDNSRDVKIAAVIEDVPGNSSVIFDFISPYNFEAASMQDWVNSYNNVYVQTNGVQEAGVLEKAVNNIVAKHSDNNNSSYFLHPMEKWRLYSDFKDGKNTGGMITYVKMFSIIAFVILLIGCINFMNLSTARSEKRAREVGIRKTLGSGKSQLMLQFFCESVILAIIALIISIIAVYLLLPVFNVLIGRQLELPVSNWQFWLLSGGIVVFTGLVAGSYPAVYLSSFNPVTVLKGTFLPGKAAATPRRLLVVAQFVISILLISSTLIIYQQIQHVKNRDLGYKNDNLLMLPSTPDISRNIQAIRNELMQSGDVYSLTQTSSPITEIYNYTPAPDYEGKPEGQMIVSSMGVSQDFTKTMGIRIIEGRDFGNTPADTSSMLLNAAAVKTMGLKNPIGAIMRYGDRNFVVRGVTENVVMTSPYQPVDPMIIMYRQSSRGTITIRLNQNTAPQKAIGTIEKVLTKYNPGSPFEYRFVDAEFNRKFVTEELIGKLTNLFAGLAIFICCLGMAGLASYTIERRLREICVRKILGASVQQLLMLIAKEFIKLVMVAFLIAVPLTWWAMNNWLQNYSYRVTVQGWIFGVVGIIVILLTMSIVWLNIARAAYANPATKLKAE
ncbi:ABC transporter permease [Flavitalea antarctica]